jgi:hypothetical protein
MHTPLDGTQSVSKILESGATGTANANWQAQHDLALAAKSTAFTAGSDDALGSKKDYYRCDMTGGAFTITLPAAASSSGRVLIFKKTDASANAFTLDGNGAETIDNAATLVGSIVRYSTVCIVCNGTGWDVLYKYL